MTFLTIFPLRVMAVKRLQDMSNQTHLAKHPNGQVHVTPDP